MNGDSEGSFSSFLQSCETLVRTILYRLRQTCSQADLYVKLLALLLNLCECRNGNDRPVCTHLVTLADWLPKVALHDGKSLQRMTLLSPIFYISCFAEDDIDMLVAQLDQINEQETTDDDDVRICGQHFLLTFLRSLEQSGFLRIQRETTSFAGAKPTLSSTSVDAQDRLGILLQRLIAQCDGRVSPKIRSTQYETYSYDGKLVYMEEPILHGSKTNEQMSSSLGVSSRNRSTKARSLVMASCSI